MKEDEKNKAIDRDTANLKKFGYDQSLKRVLPLRSLVFYGIAMICPASMLGTYGLVQDITHGMISPAYLVATLAILFTATSYFKMAKAFPIAGSVYSYTSKSINSTVGFLSGWVIIMDYMLVPMINYALSSRMLIALLPGVPYQIPYVIMVVIVTVICYFGITVTDKYSKVINILVAAFFLLLIVLIIKWLVTGNGTGALNIIGFWNGEEFSSNGGFQLIWAGAAILALNFIGFDAISSVAEEAIEPEKNVPRAIILTAVIAGSFFIIMTYLMNLCWPNGWKEFMDIDSGASELLIMIGGTAITVGFTVLYLFATMGSAIAGQNSAARVIFGMARDKILPPFFSYVSDKHKTPTYNIIAIGIISLCGCFITLEQSSTLINFGCLLGFTMVNVSVISHYFVRKKKRGLSDTVNYLIIPAIGVIICLVIWNYLGILAKIAGFVWLAIGLIIMLLNKKRNKSLDMNIE